MAKKKHVAREEVVKKIHDMRARDPNSLTGWWPAKYEFKKVGRKLEIVLESSEEPISDVDLDELARLAPDCLHRDEEIGE
jgi:hypothetical protein